VESREESVAVAGIEGPSLTCGVHSSPHCDPRWRRCGCYCATRLGRHRGSGHAHHDRCFVSPRSQRR
jgi:hypothetical protein